MGMVGVPPERGRMKTTTKLTREQVDGMNRKVMQETLEDLTALGPDDIRRMTTAKMKEELMAFTPQERKRRGKKEEEAPLVVAPTPIKLRGEKLKGEIKDKGRDCMCKCGGRTKGGHFLPGHDAKFHSANSGGGNKKTPKECGCGCNGMTRGGRYLPGHDARHYSAMLKAERAQATDKEKATAVA